MSIFLKKISLCFLFSIFLIGCGTEKKEHGIVAKVNGEAIYFSDVQERYDSQNIFDDPKTLEEVEEIYADYTLDLIIHTLIRQELEKNNILPEAKELEDAEKFLRSNYPDEETFNEICLEEYITLENWRKQVSLQLNKSKLVEKFILPQIKVAYADAENYYKNNMQEFVFAEKYEYAFLYNTSQEDKTKIRRAWQRNKNLAQLKEKFPKLDIFISKYPKDLIPASLTRLTKNLKLTEISEFKTIDGRNQALILLKIHPQVIITPVEAYPLIEEAIIEQETLDKYEIWLDTALKSADIEISDLLKNTFSFTHLGRNK